MWSLQCGHISQHKFLYHCLFSCLLKLCRSLNSFFFPVFFCWKQQKNKSPAPHANINKKQYCLECHGLQTSKLHLHSYTWPEDFYLIVCLQTWQIPITYSLKSFSCSKQHHQPLREFYRLWWALILTSLCITTYDFVQLWESIIPSPPVKGKTFV